MPKSPKPKKQRPPTPPPPTPPRPPTPEPQYFIEPEEQEYLSGLLGRFEKEGARAGGLMRGKEEGLSLQIEEGEYEIREREWSAKQQQSVQSGNSQLGTGNQRSQKQLQNELHMLQDQINSESRVEKAPAISEEERLAFIKKVEKERRELNKKKQEALRAEQEQREAEEKQKQERAQKEEEEKKAKKKQEIEERMRVLEEKRHKKDEQFKAQSAALKDKLREKIMVDKMEESYNLRQNESLEERKQRLAEIRTLHRPIDREEIDRHMTKMEQLHSERQAAAAEKKKLQQSTPTFYRSVFYRQVKQEQKTFLDQQNEEQVGRLREARDRLKKFSEYIRSSYKPTIDEKKVEELKFRRVTTQRRAHSVHHSEDTPNKVGLRYLEYSKMQAGKDQKLLGAGEESQAEEGRPAEKKQDYLQWLREKNRNRPVESAQAFIQRLEKSNLPKEEKAKRIMEFTDRLEKKAKRREQLDQSNSGVDGQLDGLYLEVIEAKLNLLEGI